MNSFSISSSLFGLGRWKPAGENEVVELKAGCCCAGQPEAVESLDKREVAGEMIEYESESFRGGTAVLEELSEENKLEPRVAEEADDLMLAPSKDRLWPLEESVETESYGPWLPALLPGLPHC